MDLLNKKNQAATAFAEAVEIMARLRGPDGCPWDREQSLDTIRKYTLEETYEVLDAVERSDWPHLQEELGDLLLQVLFYAQMASEANHFTIADVISGLNRKLIRRHPHVFGSDAAAAAGNVVQGLATESIDAAQVLLNWDEIKRSEKQEAANEEKSRLDSIPRGMPSLLEATKLGYRAAKSGFDWPDIEGLFDKLSEETSELRQAMDAAQVVPTTAQHAAVESEVGDLLFTAVNLARHLNVDPEIALRGTNAKFRRRFHSMERSAGKAFESLTLDALERLWSDAKQSEQRSAGVGT